MLLGLSLPIVACGLCLRITTFLTYWIRIQKAHMRLVCKEAAYGLLFEVSFRMLTAFHGGEIDRVARFHAKLYR